MLRLWKYAHSIPRELKRIFISAINLIAVNYILCKLTALARSGLTNEMLTYSIMLYRAPTMRYSFLSFSLLPFSIFMVGGHKTHCLVPLMTAPWNRGWAFSAHLHRNCSDKVMTLTVSCMTSVICVWLSLLWSLLCFLNNCFLFKRVSLFCSIIFIKWIFVFALVPENQLWTSDFLPESCWVILLCH